MSVPLVVRKNEFARVGPWFMLAQSPFVVFAGLMVVDSYPILGWIVLGVGALGITEGAVLLRLRDRPIATIDAEGLRTEFRLPFRRHKAIRWADTRRLELSDTRIRIVPEPGPAVSISLLEAEGSPDVIIEAITTHLLERPEVVRGALPARREAAGAFGHPRTRILLHPPSRGLQSRAVMALALGFAPFAMLVYLAVGASWSTGPALLVGVPVWLLLFGTFARLRRASVVIDGAGLQFRSFFSTVFVPWIRVESLSPVHAIGGMPALRVIVREGAIVSGWMQPRLYVLPLHWTEMPVQELVGRLQALAAPHQFEGPW